MCRLAGALSNPLTLNQATTAASRKIVIAGADRNSTEVAKSAIKRESGPREADPAALSGTGTPAANDRP